MFRKSRRLIFPSPHLIKSDTIRCNHFRLGKVIFLIALLIPIICDSAKYIRMITIRGVALENYYTFIAHCSYECANAPREFHRTHYIFKTVYTFTDAIRINQKTRNVEKGQKPSVSLSEYRNISVNNFRRNSQQRNSPCLWYVRNRLGRTRFTTVKRRS